jgi:hypothetical protein
VPQTSGYSYPRVTAIRIDVHPIGENPTNTPHASHAQSAYGPRSYVSHVSTHSNPSGDADRFGQISLLPRKGLPTQSIARRLTDPRVHTQFLSRANQWSRGRKPSSYRWPTIRLTDPISPARDRYVQYLLAGANPSVLNRHSRGLQPWRWRLATYHSSTFPTSCLHFSPKGPARSPV